MNNKKIKLVIIQSEHLTQRWESYFHLDELVDVFDVEFWDCSKFIKPQFKSFAIERDYVKIISNGIQFWKELKCLSQDSLIVLHRVIFYEAENGKYMRLLAKYFPKQVDIDFFTGNKLITKLWVESEGIEGLDEKKLNALKSPNKKPWYYDIKQLVYKSRLLRNFTKFVFRRSSYIEEKRWRLYMQNNALFKTWLISCRTDVKYAVNPPDYETYMTCISPRLIKEKYIVFIDQAFPVHPEFKTINSQYNIEQWATAYYSVMRSFFDKVEQETKHQIVIAAHPVANYKGDEYGNRQLICGHTCELVRDSEAVIVHNSMAINFAIFYNKPLMLLTNQEFEKSPRQNRATGILANYFQVPIIKIENVNMKSCLFYNVSSNKRKEYMDSIINPNTKNKTNTELLKLHLQSIYHEMYDV